MSTDDCADAFAVPRMARAGRLDFGTEFNSFCRYAGFDYPIEPVAFHVTFCHHLRNLWLHKKV
jgi:hypothetical protein